MSRVISRIKAFKTLFAIDVGGNTLEDALDMVMTPQLKDDEHSFILREVEGVLQNLPTLDEIINKYSSDWDVDRLPATDRAILRLALFEIIYCDDIPVGVSINEAVEIAKKYADAQSYRFINGLLGSAAREFSN